MRPSLDFAGDGAAQPQLQTQRLLEAGLTKQRAPQAAAAAAPNERGAKAALGLPLNAAALVNARRAYWKPPAIGRLQGGMHQCRAAVAARPLAACQTAKATL